MRYFILEIFDWMQDGGIKVYAGINRYRTRVTGAQLLARLVALPGTVPGARVARSICPL